MATTTSLQERVMIRELAQAGQSDHQIAQALGWSVHTVRKWRRRAQQQGNAGLTCPQGRPRRGPLATAARAVVAALTASCRAHPAWGPATLLAELAADPSLTGHSLPSPATIARWRKAQGHTRTYERHCALPQPPARAAQSPHEVWELDAQGAQPVQGVGVVALIHLVDRVSKVKLLSYACVLGEHRAERHPTTEDYQAALRLAFTDWGLPNRLAVDREGIFADPKTKSPFPTRWHLWLVALGIGVEFGPPHQPTDRGSVERSHQTWQQQVVQDQEFASAAALQRALRQRRDFLNEHLPCASLGDQPPLLAYPQARRPRRLYRPEAEAALLDLDRVWSYLSQGRWFRRVNRVGVLSLGNYVYGLGMAWAGQEVEIHFDPSDQHLVFTSADQQRTKRLPPQGITKALLMGDLNPLLQTAPQQLPLPLSWEDWGVIRLSETLTGTT